MSMTVAKKIHDISGKWICGGIDAFICMNNSVGEGSWPQRPNFKIFNIEVNQYCFDIPDDKEYRAIVFYGEEGFQTIDFGSGNVWMRQEKDPECSYAIGESPGSIIYHIRRNDIEAIQRLIERCTDPNLRDCVNRTPLHHAAEVGSLKAAQLLIDAGADVNAVGHMISPQSSNRRACGCCGSQLQ